MPNELSGEGHATAHLLVVWMVGTFTAPEGIAHQSQIRWRLCTSSNWRIWRRDVDLGLPVRACVSPRRELDFLRPKTASGDFTSTIGLAATSASDPPSCEFAALRFSAFTCLRICVKAHMRTRAGGVFRTANDFLGFEGA